MFDQSAHSTADHGWLGGVVAAVLTPCDAQGNPHPQALADYVARLARHRVTGIAVGAHTGRGHLLTTHTHSALVEAASSSGLPVVATASLPAAAPVHSRADVERTLLERAERITGAGASAIMCMPPPAFLEPDPDWVAQLHQQLADATGLPVIAFLLYSAAAENVTYDREHLSALAGVEGVMAVKVATLDDAIRCQDAITYLRQHAGHVRVLTGEDRMFGPSLMWGATGALIGVAACHAHLSVDLLESWRDSRFESFIAASSRLDAFARLTFSSPVEGYVQRLAWAAAHEGILPGQFALDPLAPPAVQAERQSFLRALDEVRDDSQARTVEGAR